MKKIHSTLVMLCFATFIFFSSCKGPLVPLKGVWDFSDVVKMSSFLGIPPQEAGYCVEFLGNGKAAKVKFVYLPQEFQVEVNSIGNNQYKIQYGQKSRVLTINKESSGLYAYFADSNPFPPDWQNSYDGTNTDQTMDECLKASREAQELPAYEEGPSDKNLTPGSHGE